MNNAIFIGRVTDDLVLKQTESTNMVRFSIAVQRRGHNDTADFIPMVAFGKTAEYICDFLHKGSKVAIEGRFQSGSYQNENGETVYTLNCVVNTFEALDGRKKENNEGE